ncbi:MAG: hypothetical protein O7B99_12935 [Planctomycetota bacterium]|nr:hypothetical protein [Planctomycetota bacterium]
MKAARTILLFSALVLGCNTGTGGAKGLFQLESEPNDLPCCPNVIGNIGPGSIFGIAGNITDDGSDPFDGFAFTSTTAHLLEFVLESDSGDLDLSIFDPDTGEFVAEFSSPGTVEAGFLEVLAPNKDFHLVVCSASGTTDYTLSVTGSDLPLRLSGDDPFVDQGALDLERFLPYLGTDSVAVPGEGVEVLPVGTLILFDTESGATVSAGVGLTQDGDWVSVPARF